MSSAVENYTTVTACKPADLVLAAWSCCIYGAGTDGWTAALVLIMPIKLSKIKHLPSYTHFQYIKQLPNRYKSLPP
jgi:hypothetical protein